MTEISPCRKCGHTEYTYEDIGSIASLQCDYCGTEEYVQHCDVNTINQMLNDVDYKFDEETYYYGKKTLEKTKEYLINEWNKISIKGITMTTFNDLQEKFGDKPFLIMLNFNAGLETLGGLSYRFDDNALLEAKFKNDKLFAKVFNNSYGLFEFSLPIEDSKYIQFYQQMIEG